MIDGVTLRRQLLRDLLSFRLSWIDLRDARAVTRLFRFCLGPNLRDTRAVTRHRLLLCVFTLYHLIPAIRSVEIKIPAFAVSKQIYKN